MLLSPSRLFVLCVCLLPGVACSSSDPAPSPTATAGATSKEIGPEGGELIAPEDGGFAGFELRIPPGALTQKVTVSFAGVFDETPLPNTAERVGPQIRIEPAGTVLAKPAELTFPLNPMMLAHYDGKPETCKVWARSGDSWNRIDALSHTDFSVTVPISTFGVAAAGVNFVVPTKSCAACVPVPVATPVQCDALDGSVEYCIQDLPQPEITSGLDEFSTLTVEGRKVYWLAMVNGKPTLLRYDIDNPGPVFQYAPFNGPSVGAIEARGRVAVDGSDAWVGVGGFGNLHFRATADTEAFETGGFRQPCGVADVPGFPRFYSVSSGTDTADVHIVNGRDDSVLHKVRKTKTSLDGTRTVLPTDVIVGSDVGGRTADKFPLHSLHRGIGLAFRPDAVALAAGFWGVTYKDSPTRGNELPPSTGGRFLTQVVAFDGLVHAEGLIPARVNRYDVSAPGEFTSRGESLLLPVAPLRDIAYRSANELFAISSGRLELYVVSDAGGIKTVALPDDAQLTPWRIAHVTRADSNQRDILLVSRGPLVKKGRFSLIRKR